jgi:hypothetical protein
LTPSKFNVDAEPGDEAPPSEIPNDKGGGGCAYVTADDEVGAEKEKLLLLLGGVNSDAVAVGDTGAPADAAASLKYLNGPCSTSRTF